jgi:hypothetical protein
VVPYEHLGDWQTVKLVIVQPRERKPRILLAMVGQAVKALARGARRDGVRRVAVQGTGRDGL